MLQVLNDLHGLGRVAGAVGEHDAVRVQGLDLLGRGKSGHHRYLAATLDQAADDVPLAAVVHQHNVGLTLFVVDLGLCTEMCIRDRNIPEMCKAVEAAGADAISLTNTFQACAIDLEKRKPVFNNIDVYKRQA